MVTPIVAQSFFTRYDDLVRAVATMLVALALVALVDRWLTRRAQRLATAVTGADLRPEATTRLRFLRRVVDVSIVVIGLAAALSNFTALDRLAGTVLASSAIAAAVVGFAARQVLANAIAGLLLAITQPLRIGDHVGFEEQTGVVEDVRLTNTWLRSPSGARVIIPNERLASGILRNETIVDAAVAVEASVWVHREVDAVEAADAVRGALGDATVRLAETSADGVRLLLIADPVAPADRPAREAQLREDALRAVRAVGLRA